MNHENKGIHTDLEAEVVVVGGGGAGLAAAVAAAEEGADVILLEKGSSPGGNTGIYGKEIPAVESPVQKRKLIDVSRDAVFRKAMKRCRWDCNPRVVRAFIDKSGDTIRWLEEKGIQFEMIRIHPDEDMVVFHKIVGSKELGGEHLVNILIENCRTLEVKLLCDTGAKKILTGPKGHVTGVMAITKGGEAFPIISKSVVIATGGYPAKKEWVEKYPNYHPNFSLAGLPYEGDGIAMATEVGAATEGLGALALFGPNPGRASISIEVDGKTQEIPLMVVAQEPYTVWVNKNGLRFVDEAIGYNHYAAGIPIARQPDGLSYTLFDTRILRRMCEKGFIIGLAPRIEDWELQRSGNFVGLEHELQRLAATDIVKISNTWDELADWMGAIPEVLKATIREYNEICDRGHDLIFVKERRYLLPLRTSPYYALRCQGSILHTLGGIKINEQMEAINKQGTPIPGLYAAGVDTGGWEKTLVDWLVGGLTVALNGGRIAGENAAGYARG
jgi:fumarate reductase flavoprotein subunit